MIYERCLQLHECRWWNSDSCMDNCKTLSWLTVHALGDKCERSQKMQCMHEVDIKESFHSYTIINAYTCTFAHICTLTHIHTHMHIHSHSLIRLRSCFWGQWSDIRCTWPSHCSCLFSAAPPLVAHTYTHTHTHARMPHTHTHNTHVRKHKHIYTHIHSLQTHIPFICIHYV